MSSVIIWIRRSGMGVGRGVQGEALERAGEEGSVRERVRRTGRQRGAAVSAGGLRTGHQKELRGPLWKLGGRWCWWPRVLLCWKYSCLDLVLMFPLHSIKRMVIEEIGGLLQAALNAKGQRSHTADSLFYPFSRSDFTQMFPRKLPPAPPSPILLIPSLPPSLRPSLPPFLSFPGKLARVRQPFNQM